MDELRAMCGFTAVATLLILLMGAAAELRAETEVSHYMEHLAAGDFAPGGTLTGAILGPQGLTIASAGTVAESDGLTRHLPEGTYVSPALTSDLPFNSIGLHWRESAPEGTWIDLFVSTSTDGVTWSDWRLVSGDPETRLEPYFPDGRANPFFGDVVGSLVNRYPARQGYGHYFRYKAVLATSSPTITPVLDRVTATLIDSTCPDLPPPDAPSAGRYDKPPVWARSSWGARPPAGSVTYCSPTTHLCVHHTAGPGDYGASSLAECMANVRSTQAYHMDTQGWVDLGYNIMMCKHGDIFEGRYGGDNVRGAHDGYNCPSLGVGALGYFHPPYSDAPTTALLNAFKELFAWKASQNGLNPYGRTYYSSYGGNMDVIYGHHQVSATACPGDQLIPRLGEIRDGTYDLMQGGPVGDEVIVDNMDSGYTSTGFWSTSVTPGYYGTNYEANGTGGTGSETANWRPFFATGGTYGVYVWYTEGGNRAQDAPFTVHYSSGQDLVRVNQQQHGSQWVKLGSYYFLAGSNGWVSLSDDATPGYFIIADAVRFVLETGGCSLDLDASYAAGTLSLDFIISSLEPTTWANYLILTYPAEQVIPLWTISLPVIATPMAIPLSFPLPNIGWVGIWSGLFAAGGAEDIELVWVDTGW